MIPNWMLWTVVIGLVDVLLFVHMYKLDKETPTHRQQKTPVKQSRADEILEQHVLTLPSGNIWGVLNIYCNKERITSGQKINRGK